MVVLEAAGGADPLGEDADQQVQDWLHGHDDRGQQARPVGPLQPLLLVDILVANDWVAEVCIQLADEDLWWDLEEAEQ